MKKLIMVACMAICAFTSCELFLNDVSGFIENNRGSDFEGSIPENTNPQLEYILSTDGNYMVKGTEYTTGEVIIPELYEGIPVSGIEASGFANNTSITGFVLPLSVKSIGSGAFNGCTALQYIIIPSSVDSIHMNCFSGCNNVSVYVEASAGGTGFVVGWDNGVSSVLYGLNTNWYKLSFDSNGGSVVPPIPFVLKEMIEEFPIPIKEGKTFDGWYTKAGDKVTAPIIQSGSLTFYAQWK